MGRWAWYCGRKPRIPRGPGRQPSPGTPHALAGYIRPPLLQYLVLGLTEVGWTPPRYSVSALKKVALTVKDGLTGPVCGRLHSAPPPPPVR